MTKDMVRASIEASPGTNAYRSYALKEARPVLHHIWNNHVPWIVRKLVNFIGAIDDYLEDYEATPIGDR